MDRCERAQQALWGRAKLPACVSRLAPGIIKARWQHVCSVICRTPTAPVNGRVSPGELSRTLSGLAKLWLPLSLGAILASAAHVVIDFVADVYPGTVSGYLLVALPAALLYGVWVWALLKVRDASVGAIELAAIFALIQAALANGLAGLFPCPPVALWGGEAPCPFSPVQDLAHIGSLAFGLAAYFAIRALKADAREGDALFKRAGFVLLAVHLLLAGVVVGTK